MPDKVSRARASSIYHATKIYSLPIMCLDLNYQKGHSFKINLESVRNFRSLLFPKKLFLLKEHTNSSDQCWFVFILVLNNAQVAVLAFQQQTGRQNKSDFFKRFLQEFLKGELVATRQHRFYFLPLLNDARACCYFGFSATNYRPAKINLNKQSFFKDLL